MWTADPSANAAGDAKPLPAAALDFFGDDKHHTKDHGGDVGDGGGARHGGASRDSCATKGKASPTLRGSKAPSAALSGTAAAATAAAPPSAFHDADAVSQFRHAMGIAVSGSKVEPPAPTFADIAFPNDRVRATLLHNVETMEFAEPTAVQVRGGGGLGWRAGGLERLGNRKAA